MPSPFPDGVKKSKSALEAEQELAEHYPLAVEQTTLQRQSTQLHRSHSDTVRYRVPTSSSPTSSVHEKFHEVAMAILSYYPNTTHGTGKKRKNTIDPPSHTYNIWQSQGVSILPDFHTHHSSPRTPFRSNGTPGMSQIRQMCS